MLTLFDGFWFGVGHALAEIIFGLGFVALLAVLTVAAIVIALWIDDVKARRRRKRGGA